MYYVWIDITKNFHVVTIIDENEVKVTQKSIRVTNCIDGFSKFITKLETISSNTNDFIIGLEATGIYGGDLSRFKTPIKFIGYLGLFPTENSSGNSKQEGIIAVARKLATIIYSIFRYNTPYDPSRVFSKS